MRERKRDRQTNTMGVRLHRLRRGPKLHSKTFLLWFHKLSKSSNKLGRYYLGHNSYIWVARYFMRLVPDRKEMVIIY